MPYHTSPCKGKFSLVLLVCENNKSKDLLWQGNQSELPSGFFYVKSNTPTYQSIFSFYLRQEPYIMESTGLLLHLLFFQYPNALSFHYSLSPYNILYWPSCTNAEVYHTHSFQILLYSYSTSKTLKFLLCHIKTNLQLIFLLVNE